MFCWWWSDLCYLTNVGVPLFLQYFINQWKIRQFLHFLIMKLNIRQDFTISRFNVDWELLIGWHEEHPGWAFIPRLRSWGLSRWTGSPNACIDRWLWKITAGRSHLLGISRCCQWVCSHLKASGGVRFVGPKGLSTRHSQLIVTAKFMSWGPVWWLGWEVCLRTRDLRPLII